MIKVVIFDMDGVLVESEHLYIEAEKQTMLNHGIKISADELHKYTGTTAKHMFTEFIRKYNLDTNFEKLNKEKEKILFKLLEEETRPTKGVIELIFKLKQNNIKLGIASSSNKKVIKYVLKKLNLSHSFQSILSSDDITHSKPDPEIFLKSAYQLEEDPEKCLVIEDSNLGVNAAKKAGMKCVGYINPNSGNQDLSSADMIVSDFSKLYIQEILSL